MKSHEKNESNLKIEIQKTLISIYNLTSNIKSELEVIKDYTRKDGQLRTAILEANETLTAVAQDANIDIKRILNSNKDDNENEESESQPNLRSILTPIEYEEKILSLLNDM